MMFGCAGAEAQQNEELRMKNKAPLPAPPEGRRALPMRANSDEDFNV
jgi:hypothetical protein